MFCEAPSESDQERSCLAVDVTLGVSCKGSEVPSKFDPIVHIKADSTNWLDKGRRSI